MQPKSENKIVLVKRKTRLDDLIARFNTLAQAKFYIEHLGADFSDYVKEHETYYTSLERSKILLSGLGRLQVIDRVYLPSFIFGANDAVVALGQDGVVANTMKYLDGQPLLGVNPDSDRYEGKLLPYQVDDLSRIVPGIFENGVEIKEVTMAKASLSDGQTLYAVNDLFIGAKTHVSARYSLEIGDRSENQSSSGIIVSTGLGSTGWYRSIVNSAYEISYGYANQKLKEHQFATDFDWSSPFLVFSVREAWPSKNTGSTLVYGKIEKKRELKIHSTMSEGGTIFSDGIESDFLSFNSGMAATISIAEKKGRLVV